MKSAQLNFFMMPEDIAEMIKILPDFKMLLLKDIYQKNIPLPTDNIDDNSFFYIVPQNLLTEVKLKYYESHKCYIVQQEFSPVIEFLAGHFNSEENILQRGRLFYWKEYYNENNEITEQPEELLYSSKKLFTWFKKKFLPSKKKFYYITKRVEERLIKENIKLIMQ